MLPTWTPFKSIFQFRNYPGTNIINVGAILIWEGSVVKYESEIIEVLLRYYVLKESWNITHSNPIANILQRCQ